MLKKLESLCTEDQLQEYHCKVAQFSERHLILTIRIHHPQIANSTRHLDFVGVYYFEGPIFWIGANFTAASHELSKEIWKCVHPEQSDERINQVTKIFHTCIVPGADVKIAYGGFSISEGPPQQPV